MRGKNWSVLRNGNEAGRHCVSRGGRARAEREGCILPSSGNVPVGRCPPAPLYCGEGAALALLPAPFRPACLTSRFICRQSARVFSSPALQACFADRDAARLSRRWSRRDMPFVCADAGAMPASTTTVARTPRLLQNLIFRRMRFSFWCSDRSAMTLFECIWKSILFRAVFPIPRRDPRRQSFRQAEHTCGKGSACKVRHPWP